MAVAQAKSGEQTLSLLDDCRGATARTGDFIQPAHTTLADRD